MHSSFDDPYRIYLVFLLNNIPVFFFPVLSNLFFNSTTCQALCKALGRLCKHVVALTFTDYSIRKSEMA